MTGEDGELPWSGDRADPTEVDIVSALAGSRIAAWHWDTQNGLQWSADAARALNVPEIVLWSPDLLDSAVDPGDMAVVARAVRHAWRYGGRVNARIRASFASGESRWFDVIGRVVRDDNGRPTGATGVALEVSEDHEAGQAIAEALAEAEATLDRLLTVVGEWDPTGDVVTIARQAPGLTLVNDPPSRVALGDVLTRTGTRDGGRVRQALQRALEDRRNFTLDLLFRDDPGELRRVLLRGGPIGEGAIGDPAERVWMAMTVLD